MYSDEKKIDDIVVKVHSEFTLCNREGDLELYFNDNLVELNVFELINSYDKKEIYNFTFEDNVASSVIISEMNQPFWSNNKALDNIDVAFEAKKEASIVLESSAINMMVNDRENFTFNPIKVGDYFSLIDSQINFDRESLKNREVELDTDFFYLKNSSISFEGANKEKVGLYTRGATTLDDCEITCVDYSLINKTISTKVIGGEAQKTKIKLENAVIDSGVSYYSNVKYDFSTFEIINSKIENEGDEILSLANGISITNSTVKNTLKLANVLIENADIDNLVLENKGKDHDSFLVQTSTVDGDNKLVFDNSVFNNAGFYLTFSTKESKESGCAVSFCDISDRFSAVNLTKMEGTISSSIVFLDNVSTVKDSCLQNYNVSYKTPTLIVNFDSNKGEEIGTCHEKDNLSYNPL